MFWNMVDRRGRKDLYEAWNRVIHRMGLRLLSSRVPNTLRYTREADPVRKVSSVPRCSRPIPVRRRIPAFRNWWRRYAAPSVWRNLLPAGRMIRYRHLK